MFSTITKQINAIFIDSSQMPFYSLFRLHLAYDIIIYI